MERACRSRSRDECVDAALSCSTTIGRWAIEISREVHVYTTNYIYILYNLYYIYTHVFNEFVFCWLTSFLKTVLYPSRWPEHTSGYRLRTVAIDICAISALWIFDDLLQQVSPEYPERRESCRIIAIHQNYSHDVKSALKRIDIQPECCMRTLKFGICGPSKSCLFHFFSLLGRTSRTQMFRFLLFLIIFCASDDAGTSIRERWSKNERTWDGLSSRSTALRPWS